MTGVVNESLEAIVPVTVLSPSSEAVEFQAVVDTGFDGFLALPQAEVARLGLPVAGFVDALLGDGSEVELAMFRANVTWQGEIRTVSVLEAEGGPLLGTGLLAGGELRVEFAAGGRVVIAPLSARRAER